MLTLPGLIDPHVHLREPGAIHKEDWATGTAAALAGGFTCILAMPNTQPPLLDALTWNQVQSLAQKKALCDFGLFLGAGQDNMADAPALANKVCGLKMYLDQTYGPLRLAGLNAIAAHMQRWPSTRPIVVHAEGHSLAMAILLAILYDKRLHIAHVSRAEEIALIRLAKERGWPVTCEVTPHHLFLSERDIPALGPGRSTVRPPLASAADVQALWDNLNVIDCFASDHAPHLAEEKDGPNPPPGFPGLETALPLFLAAVRAGRLSLDDLMLRMYSNPRRIFGLPEQPQTYIQVDQDSTWVAHGASLHSRCGWTPWEGQKMRGRVIQVTLRGQVVYRDGQILAKPGSGRNLIWLSGGR